MQTPQKGGARAGDPPLDYPDSQLYLRSGRSPWRLRSSDSSIPPAELIPHEPLVDGAVLADDLPQVLRSLFVRSLVGSGTASRAGDDVGAGTPRFPVVAGDLRVHGGQPLLRFPVVLSGVGDEVALHENVRDGAVGHLDG